MRIPPCGGAWAAGFALLSIVNLARGAEPRFRPALIGSGPKALVNVINTKKLVEKGQGDGLLMFKCGVRGSGKVANYIIYRETPGSKLLKEEVGNALRNCEFIPGIYNGQIAEVVFAGTVVLFVTDGKPHLRIFANQNPEDIKRANDFVAPQLLANSPDWKVTSADPFLAKARVYKQKGAVEFSITVDANGNQKDLKVIVEDPPGFGFAHDARKTFCDGEIHPRVSKRTARRMYV